MLEKGVELFQNLRNEFNSIKKQNAEDFAEEVLTNAEINKLLKIDSSSKTKNIEGAMTLAEKLAFKSFNRRSCREDRCRKKKIGTRWEDKTKLNSLLAELRKRMRKN